MNKFIKENWFKISVLVVILIAIILLFFYGLKQQEIEKQKQLGNLNATCQKLAFQKKDEINKDDSELYIGTYEYKYNLTHQACILAYTGSYFGDSLGAIFGHNLFQIENLSTGESIMNIQVDPGDLYRKTNEEFEGLKNEYLK